MAESYEKRGVAKTVGIVVTIVALLIILGIGLFLKSYTDNKDAADQAERANTTEDTVQQTESVPQEPSNPNVTGGSTGTGNAESNDQDIQTPSPAGGVDTNGQVTP